LFAPDETAITLWLNQGTPELMMTKNIVALAMVAALLAGCGGRFAGFGNCSSDGSVVWWEYPNSAGSYEGLNNSPENCRK